MPDSGPQNWTLDLHFYCVFNWGSESGPEFGSGIWHPNRVRISGPRGSENGERKPIKRKWSHHTLGTDCHQYTGMARHFGLTGLPMTAVPTGLAPDPAQMQALAFARAAGMLETCLSTSSRAILVKTVQNTTAARLPSCTGQHKQYLAFS